MNKKFETGLKTKSQLYIYTKGSFRINSLKKVESKMALWKESSSDMRKEKEIKSINTGIME